MASRAPLRWTVVFGWCLRWNWSWFRDKLVKASTRPHTTSTYQGDLHAMPAKSLAFHKQQGRVGGQVPFCYLCAYIKRKYIYHAKCKPQPPTYQTDTFTQVISLRHQVSELFTLIFCPYTLLPSLSWLPGMGTYVMNTRAGWNEESRHANAPSASPVPTGLALQHWKKRSLAGTATKTPTGLRPQWRPVAWFHVPEELPKIAVNACEQTA